MALLRLGDDIDDYCVRCKRVTNHSIVSMLSTEPAKMRCRTCYSEHDYRHGEAPPSKKDLRKSALFNEVLAGVNPAPAAQSESESTPAKKATGKK